MHRYYTVRVDKRRVGSAIQLKEPALQGEIIVKVTDMQTQGSHKLVVVDADEGQHTRNLAHPSVEELDETAAADLAAQFQPERTVQEPDPETRQMKERRRPAANLTEIIVARTQGGGKDAGQGQQSGKS